MSVQFSILRRRRLRQRNNDGANRDRASGRFARSGLGGKQRVGWVAAEAVTRRIVSPQCRSLAGGPSTAISPLRSVCAILMKARQRLALIQNSSGLSEGPAGQRAAGRACRRPAAVGRAGHCWWRRPQGEEAHARHETTRCHWRSFGLTTVPVRFDADLGAPVPKRYREE